jgi:probable HAF family extracellular repeat protein
MSRAVRAAAVFAIVVMTLAAAPPVEWRYVAIDLGTLGGDHAWARGINDRGQVVGESLPPSGPIHAFLWQNGRMFDLGVLPGDNSSAALDINNRGQVVGAGALDDNEPHALLWDRGTIINLGALLDDGFSMANAINNRGQIVGSANSPTGGGAVLWEKGVATFLDGLDWANDINDRSVVAGTSFDPATNLPQAMIWRDGETLPLGVLPGDEFSEAHAVNNRNQVVGVSGHIAQGRNRAFLWEDGVMRERRPQDGDAHARAHDINERAQVAGVGISATTFANRATLFYRGEAVRLPMLPNQQPSSTAEAINNRGQIVGVTSVDPLGARAVIWVPAWGRP